MKKFLKGILIFIIIGIISFVIFKLSDKYKLKILKNNIECTIVTKGCKNAKALVYDGGNVYIGYKHSIKLIDNEGKEKNIYESSGDIEDIEIADDKIFIIANDKLIVYSIEENNERVIISSLPKGGNDIDRKLLVNDRKLYLSINAKSNAGILEGEEIENIPTEHNEDIGNGALYVVNLDNYSIDLYASGIRGITGLDTNSKGQLYGIFSGMLEDETRGVKRDKDYIYLLEKDKWYGWPDFSGGDYITSPRFAGDDLVKPLLSNIKSKVVPGPIYVNKDVNSIRELAIDKVGIVLPKNGMVFWDKNNQSVYCLTENKALIEVLKLTDDSYIEDLVFTDDGLFILDSSTGCIYNLHTNSNILRFNLPLAIRIYIAILLISIVSIIFLKKRDKKIN